MPILLNQMVGGSIRSKGQLLLKAGIFLILILGLTGCSLFPKEEDENVPALVQPPTEEVVTHVIAEEQINEELSDSAQVGSGQEKTLYFTIPGRVNQVKVEDGALVKKGQLLLSLETRDLEYAIKQAKLNLEQEQLRFQSQQYDINANSIAKQITVIGLERARLEHEHLLEQLDRSVIRAPFDGKITDQRATRGGLVDAFTPVVTMIAMKGLQLGTEVDYNTMKRLRLGMPVRIELDEGSPQMGHISAITRRENLSVNNDSYYVLVRTDDPRFQLNPDNNYTIAFILHSIKKALVVPNDMIREDVNGKNYLRVIEGKHRRDVYIKTGITNDTKTQILEGAAAGMTVVGK